MEDSKPSNLIKVCVVINNAVKKEKKVPRPTWKQKYINHCN